MTFDLKPQISSKPIFIVLLIAISIVIVIFIWSHLEKQKEHAFLALKQSLETQKHYFNSMMEPIGELTNQRTKQRRTQQVLNQTQLIWNKEIEKYPALKLSLASPVKNNDQIDAVKTILSAGNNTQQQIPSFLPEIVLSLIAKYIPSYFEPYIIQLRTSALDDQYQIIGTYRFPTTFEFLESIFFYIALAFSSAALFSWFAVSQWRTKTNKDIALSQTRYQEFVKQSNDWLWEVDRYGNLTFCSENSYKIFGYYPSEMIGRSLYEFLYSSSSKQDQQNIDMYISNAADIKFLETHFSNNKGRPILIELNAQAVKNDKQQVIAYRGTGRDLTEQKKKEDTIVSVAYYDALTQLPNRENLVKRVEDHLNQVLQRKDLLLSALILVDLDDFKDINSYQGHDTGNNMLQVIARRLQSFVNKKDIIFRLSGDQFVILIISPNRMLMPEFKLKLETFINEVLEIINKPLELDGQNALVTASAGIALIPQDGRTVSELLSHADSAMYQAKRDGKNRYRYFDASMRELEDYKKQIARDLKQAIDHKEFQLYYQLQIDTETKDIYGMEALIRWPHPTRNALVSPSEFIQIAVESNHIQAIDEWVIEQALKDVYRLHEATNKTIPVSINLSAKTLENPNLPYMLSAKLDKYYLSPSDLRIEVTETSILKNIDNAITNLGELKKRGIATSIDDFGTGYSSLSYLQKLPVDTLKIDKSFVDGIGTNQQDLQICKSIIHLAKTLDKKIIAEGVQSEVQKELLEAEGCNLIQGYLYSRPIPIEDIILQNKAVNNTVENIASTEQPQSFRLIKEASK